MVVIMEYEINFNPLAEFSVISMGKAFLTINEVLPTDTTLRVRL